MRKAVVITVSDSCAAGMREDGSGPAVAQFLHQHGFEVVRTGIVPDDIDAIRTAVSQACESADFVVTSGGTGISERDVTPEAVRPLCSRVIEGIAERMRAQGALRTSFAVLSRGICGIRERSIILTVPGSPKGAVQSLEAVIELIPHALDLLAGNTQHGSGVT